MARKQPEGNLHEGKTGVDTTGTATGGKGQPPGGEKDSRGLTRDGTGFAQEPEGGKPTDAASGPWAVHPEPKGD
jgi:hypothetical protein